MCLHKHTTIVHRHLYNIKGVIYKSTGVVTQRGAGWGAPPRFPHPGGANAQGRVTRPGVSIFGPVVWEGAGL